MHDVCLNPVGYREDKGTATHPGPADGGVRWDRPLRGHRSRHPAAGPRREQEAQEQLHHDHQYPGLPQLSPGQGKEIEKIHFFIACLACSKN
jgi:hypothetical protein